jgi:hypothetical protein
MLILLVCYFTVPDECSGFKVRHILLFFPLLEAPPLFNGGGPEAGVSFGGTISSMLYSPGWIGVVVVGDCGSCLPVRAKR